MTSKKDKNFNINDYVPKRFGVNYSPPMIVIEYLTPSTGKLYHHKMRIHKFTPEKKTSDVMKEIYDRHGMYLDKKKVNANQIIKLIEKIKVNWKPRKGSEDKKENKKKEDPPAPKKEEPPKVEEKKGDDEEEDYYFDEFDDEDLNKLDDEALDEKKAKMDKYYDKNNIKVGDENFQYDVRKDFNDNEYAAEWDEDSY